MSSLSTLSVQLRSSQNLSAEQVSFAAKSLASAEIADGEKVEFLSALADKGENASEIASFAAAFRAVALDPGVQAWAPKAVDVVGTGGDHAGGFNVSSLVVLTVACAGVPVMKHGNRGITSKCGSADLISAFGYDITAAPDKLRRSLDQLGYAFFFAPNFHPAFKHIAPARKALAAQGRRSIFNILGPLINPGRPAYGLLGVYSPSLVNTFAEALTILGGSSGIVAHGVIAEGKGIDELTTATDNQVRGYGKLKALSATWRAADYGFSPSPFTDIKGGDLETNLAIVESILAGKGPQGLVDTVVLNAATCLWIAGRVRQIDDGVGIARENLVGGAVRARIAATREFFAK